MGITMLGRLMKMIVDFPNEMLGVLCDLVEKLAGEAGQEWLGELKKFLRKERCWTGTVLNFVGTVKLPATSKLFFARRKFVKDISRKARVRISYVGFDFTERFLGKVEEAMAETELRYMRPIEASRDDQIRAEIGVQFEETALSHVYALMEKQANGKNGPLLTDGYANVFYIRDVDGVLRAVLVGWGGDGWDLFALSLGNRVWDKERQIFSRCPPVPQNK